MKKSWLYLISGKKNIITSNIFFFAKQFSIRAPYRNDIEWRVAHAHRTIEEQHGVKFYKYTICTRPTQFTNELNVEPAREEQVRTIRGRTRIVVEPTFIYFVQGRESARYVMRNPRGDNIDRKVERLIDWLADELNIDIR